MNTIISFILIDIVILIYTLIIKFFTSLFKATGLTKEQAHFQVVSLLTNSGYTTNESELVTGDTKRRKVAKVIMISGLILNVFIASLVINILINIHNSNLEDVKNISITISCLIAFIVITKIPRVSKFIDKVIDNLAYKLINRKNSHYEYYTYRILDNLEDKFLIKLTFKKIPDSLLNKKLNELELSNFNLTLVSLIRNNEQIALDNVLEVKDQLIVLGNLKELLEICK